MTGYGQIDGRTVYVFFAGLHRLRGSLSEYTPTRSCKVMDLAMKNVRPIIA